jgi:hypothetical protein
MAWQIRHLWAMNPSLIRGVLVCELIPQRSPSTHSLNYLLGFGGLEVVPVPAGDCQQRCSATTWLIIRLRRRKMEWRHLRRNIFAVLPTTKQVRNCILSDGREGIATNPSCSVRSRIWVWLWCYYCLVAEPSEQRKAEAGFVTMVSGLINYADVAGPTYAVCAHYLPLFRSSRNIKLEQRWTVAVRCRSSILCFHRFEAPNVFIVGLLLMQGFTS